MHASPDTAALLAAWSFAEDLDAPAMILLGVVLTVLGCAWAIGWILARRTDAAINPATVKTFNQRVHAWWMMCAILIAALFLGRIVTVVLFGLVSFWALREFITMTPTRRGDHRALFWAFFLFTPLQYLFVAIGRSWMYEPGMAEASFDWLAQRPESWAQALRLNVDFYAAFSILIPVYASLLIPAQIAVSGDHKRFLERAAKIQASLLICVYALSYAPALLDLHLLTWDAAAEELVPWGGSRAGLLFYFVLMVQLGDVFHFAWDRLLGRHVIAEQINATKTWEGFLGSIVCTSLAGLVFTWVTPFTLVGSACMAASIALMGAAGSLTMSAIKRDRGVSDYGTLVTGHAGVLDRIDSLCFAAPVFYHATRFFLHAG